MLFVPVFEGEDGSVRPAGSRCRERGRDRTRPFGRRISAGKLYERFIARVLSGPYRAARVALVGAGQKCGYQRRAFAAESRRPAATLRGYGRFSSAAWIVRGGLDALDAAGHAADGFSTAEFDCRHLQE